MLLRVHWSSCVKVRFHSHSPAVSFKKALNIDWIFCPRWETCSCILRLDPCCHHVGIIQPEIFFLLVVSKIFLMFTRNLGEDEPILTNRFQNGLKAHNYFCVFKEVVSNPLPAFPCTPAGDPSLPNHFHRRGEALSAPARRSTSFAGLRHLAQPTGPAPAGKPKQLNTTKQWRTTTAMRSTSLGNNVQ